MVRSENIHSQDYFVKSPTIWFPDFSEVVENQGDYYGKSSSNFSSFIAILRVFHKELTRAQFAAYFLEQDAPQKMLSKHRKLYNCAQELCTAYRNRLISDVEFDEQLLLSFRNRPTEDVFSPSFESWDDITRLISRLEKKQTRLPVFFDGLAWNSYLKGIVTRRTYVEAHLDWDTGGYLAQLLAYGTDSVKDPLKEKYSTEVSVSMRLKNLCFDYKNDSLSPDDFESQFLQLAREFCSDIVE